MSDEAVRQAPGGPRLRIEKDSDAVFDAAIRAGVLSDDPGDERFAGLYMYMHHDRDGVAHFKHKETRAYLRMRPAGPADGSSADGSPAGGKAAGGRTDDEAIVKRAAGPGRGLWATVALAGMFLAGALVDFERGGPRIGTVRLGNLTAEFYAGAVRNADSPEATAQAAREWGMQLESALDEVAARQGVVLLPVEAVAAGAGDYTVEVRAAMRRRAADPRGSGDGQAETGP